MTSCGASGAFGAGRPIGEVGSGVTQTGGAGGRTMGVRTGVELVMAIENDTRSSPEREKKALLRGSGFLCRSTLRTRSRCDQSFANRRVKNCEGRRIFSPEGLGNASWSGNALRWVPIWALKAAARLVELSSVAVRRTKYKPNKPNKTVRCF